MKVKMTAPEETSTPISEKADKNSKTNVPQPSRTEGSTSASKG